MNTNLPIFAHATEITEAVENYDTVIVSAETGSGKSTQVPQYLYNIGYDVIVTQPRRIACITLAERVGKEVQNTDEVSYHTGFESNVSKSSKIIFCTDGIQIAKGIKDVENTILIIDEVHEWNLNIETLVAWVKQYRKTHRLKVVLMSATMEVDKLAKFYGDDVKVIKAEGRHYNVEMHKDSGYNFNDTIISKARQGKNVLAFVEGKAEINSTIEEIQRSDVDAVVLPLHSECSSAEQQSCFDHYDLSKIVVATNIAQTSITIPDIDVVVDNGKEKRIEVYGGIEGLYTRDISQSDCLQRAGRAGRTKDGEYILCSYSELSDRDEYSTPEIERLLLDKVVLKLISVGIDPLEIEFFHQPKMENLLAAYKTLKLIGAIDDEDKITDIGKRMVKIPTSARTARMLIEAEKIHCVDKMIKAVSIIETGTLVSTRKNKPGFLSDNLRWQYSDFVSEQKSDILAEIEIYDNIIAHKYQDLDRCGLNKKSFFRAKELIEKLRFQISDDFDMEYEEPSKFEFIKCITAGIPDQFFISRGDSYYGIDHDGYKLSNGSCLQYYSAKYVYGFPRTITYKDRWGYMCTMDIITMASTFTDSEFFTLFADEIKTEYHYDEMSYDANSDCFILSYTSTFHGVVVKSGSEIIAEEDKQYEEFKIKYADKVEAAAPDIVVIGTKLYPIERRYDGSSVIYIDSSDDIMKSTLTTLKDKNGKQVKFYSMVYGENTNLSVIKNNIANKAIKRNYDNLERTIGNIKRTGSPAIVVEKMLPLVDQYNIGFMQYGIDKMVYVGLDIDKSSAYLRIYDTKEKADESTIETLKELVRLYVRSKFSDKNFIVKINGKKVETKQCKAAKEEFHEFVDEVVNEVTASTFMEQINFISELFDEYMEKINAA